MSLHESGHAVVGVGLFGGTATGVLGRNGGGLAHGKYRDPATAVSVAILVAAGRAAENLSDDYGPPCAIPGPAGIVGDAPSLPCPATPGENLGMERGVPDAQVVDRCAVNLDVPPELLFLWRRFIRDSARELVARHELRIVSTAMQLYRFGRVNVTAPNTEPRDVPAADPAAAAAQEPAEPAGV